MFFCLPILVGCQQTLSSDGDSTIRICPNCHNASAFSVKKSRWFTFFMIPVIPFPSKRVWFCQTCRWTAPLVSGEAEPPAASHGRLAYLPGYVNAVPATGTPANSYQPVYLHSSVKK